MNLTDPRVYPPAQALLLVSIGRTRQFKDMLLKHKQILLLILTNKTFIDVGPSEEPLRGGSFHVVAINLEYKMMLSREMLICGNGRNSGTE